MKLLPALADMSTAVFILLSLSVTRVSCQSVSKLRNCPTYVAEATSASCECYYDGFNNLIARAQWTGQASSNTASSTLILQSVTRGDNGTQYTCRVTGNGLMVAPSVFTLRVAYGPSEGHTAISQSRVKASEINGWVNSLRLTCSASQVSPPPRFTWTGLTCTTTTTTSNSDNYLNTCVLTPDPATPDPHSATCIVSPTVGVTGPGIATVSKTILFNLTSRESSVGATWLVAVVVSCIVIFTIIIVVVVVVLVVRWRRSKNYTKKHVREESGPDRGTPVTSVKTTGGCESVVFKPDEPGDVMMQNSCYTSLQPPRGSSESGFSHPDEPGEATYAIVLKPKGVHSKPDEPEEGWCSNVQNAREEPEFPAEGPGAASSQPRYTNQDGLVYTTPYFTEQQQSKALDPPPVTQATVYSSIT